MKTEFQANTLAWHIEKALMMSGKTVKIDDLRSNGPREMKADYLIDDNSIVVEQKELIDTPEHRTKGVAYRTFIREMIIKYGIDPDFLTSENVDILFSQLNSDEMQTHLSLRGHFMKRLNNILSKADKQISYTKRTCSINNASGVALLIFDQVSGIFPPILIEQISKTIDSRVNIDSVVYSIRLKGLTYKGKPQINGTYSKPNGLEAGRRVLDMIKAYAGSKNPRHYYDPHAKFEQTVDDLFT